MACLRLNPGNIRKPAHIRAVADEAKDRGVPIRIGVNAGSLDPDIEARHGGATPEALVESAQRELAYFEEVDFDDVKISVKASNVGLMIEAYRQLSEVTDHPLHLGVTEAGPPPAGLIKATAGIATLLAEGIGDTIRYSLTADPGGGGPGRPPAAGGPGPAGTQDRGPHRLSLLWPGRGRRHRRGQSGRGRPGRAQPAHPGGGHGLCGQRPGRGQGGRHRHRRRPGQGPPVRQGEAWCGWCPRPTWSPPWWRRPSDWWPRASTPAWPRPTWGRWRRPSATAWPCSPPRATTPTPSTSGSSSSARPRTLPRRSARESTGSCPHLREQKAVVWGGRGEAPLPACAGGGASTARASLLVWLEG